MLDKCLIFHVRSYWLTIMANHVQAMIDKYCQSLKKILQISVQCYVIFTNVFSHRKQHILLMILDFEQKKLLILMFDYHLLLTIYVC